MPDKSPRTLQEEELTRIIDYHFNGYLKIYYNKEKERYYVEVRDGQDELIYVYNYNDLNTAVLQVYRHIKAKYILNKDRPYNNDDGRWEIRNQ